ncbi:MAG: ATP-binding protein [Leptolyngbya sp. SIO1D8]|nr:ATP-binding protein [Leptolyngbya sp. SIO1D8]
MPEGPNHVSLHNQQALNELCRLLRFSQGEFALILAVCNSTGQRQTLVEQLRQQCPVTFDEMTLLPTTQTLFTTLRHHIDEPPPAALMVYGLDEVQDLEQVLTATNQIREEFRQLPFPLVLWLTDDGLKQLLRNASDFYTWANPIAFQTPAAFFLSFLDQLIQDVQQQVLYSRENRFLSNHELGLNSNSPKRRELTISLGALEAQQIPLRPDQAAALAFVQGRIADNNTATAREHYEDSLTQWQALIADPRAEQHADWPVNLGYVQFYLGLWWRNHAERHRQVFEKACQQACEYFAATVQTFTDIQRPDLTDKYINYWAESLHRLEQWEELAPIAQQALTLHEQQENPFRMARAEGFLSSVALAKADWPDAQRHAETALALIQPIAVETLLQDLSSEDVTFYAWVNSFHRSWYLFGLGRAQFEQGQIDASVETLEQARRITQPEYDPELYSNVLSQLRQGYFEQGRYLEAFEIRRHKDAIESRFNYRAFVGAGRLQPKQQITNPALPAEETPQDLIFTSGRKHDVRRLVTRLSQDEYVLTIVYGPSGVGKSSLIEAGLVPALEQGRLETRRVVPVYLRHYRNWLGELEKALVDHLKPPQAQDLSVIPTGPEPAPPVGQPSQMGRGVSFLRQQTQRNRVIVLIFDQFEEFFFEFKQPAARRIFYDFLRDCLQMPYVKVVLSLREDYIHFLLECDRLTTLDIIDNNILDKKWLYYLGNFTLEDTKAVIQDLTGPTPYTPEPEMVEQVVADLAAGAGEVRPIELQIVGAQLQTEGLTAPQAYHDWGDPTLPTKELLVQKYLTERSSGQSYLLRHIV